MRDYFYDVTPHITNGLRPFQNLPREMKFCEDLFGLVPSRYQQGGEGPYGLSYPVTGLTNHYSMEFASGGLKRYLISMNSSAPGIYSLSSAYAASLEKSFTGMKSVETDSGSVTPLEDKLFHTAQIGDLFVGSNGSYWVTNCGLYSSWAAGSLADHPTPQTVCSWNERLVMGGWNVGNDYFSSSDWLEIWSTFRQYSKIDPGSAITSAHIFIGPPRGGDISKPGLLEHVMMTGYLYSTHKTILLDYIRKGLIQAIRVPSALNILKVLPLGNNLQLYTNFGTYQANPEGYVGRSWSGSVYSRDSVAGSLERHISVDREFDLWQHTIQGNKVLGFKEFLSPIPYHCVIWDTKYEEAYITGGTANFRNSTGENIKSYLLRGERLCESRYRPTSLISDVAGLYGIFTDGGTGIRVLSTPINFDRQGFAHVRRGIIQFDRITSPILDIRYRYSGEASFRTYTERMVDGVASVNKRALEFKAGFTGTASTNPYLGQMELRYDPVDKRFIKGLTQNDQRFSDGETGRGEV